MTRNLTSQEVADRRRKTPQALAKERARGEGPAYIQDGRRILYPEDLLDEWLKERLVVPAK
jgi:hypothetical protein